MEENKVDRRHREGVMTLTCSIQCFPEGVTWSRQRARGIRRCRIISRGIICPMSWPDGPQWVFSYCARAPRKKRGGLTQRFARGGVTYDVAGVRDGLLDEVEAFVVFLWKDSNVRIRGSRRNGGRAGRKGVAQDEERGCSLRASPHGSCTASTRESANSWRVRNHGTGAESGQSVDSSGRGENFSQVRVCHDLQASA